MLEIRRENNGKITTMGRSKTSVRPVILSHAEPTHESPIPDDRNWSTRSALWQRRYSLSREKDESRDGRRPLIVSGHGASLRVEAGTLLIRNGFSHFPQKQETSRYFKGTPERPQIIILLDCSGTISFDVLSWLQEQDISLVRIDWRGNVVCVASRSGYSANPYRVQWQRETRENHEKRLEFASGTITQKIENSILTLEKAVRKNPAWNNAMEKAYSTLTALDNRQPQTISDLRILEANAAASYFRAWKGIPIKWRGTSRRPIPDSWKEIVQRTSLFHRAGSRNAHHPVNAALNYAYTVLQSKLQIEAIAEGYDPTIGIMHEATDGSAAFIFDIMEPYRPQVDRKILELIKGHTFDPADFVIRGDGVCRLNPEMARVVAGLAGA